MRRPKGSIGGSDVGVILGLSPFKSPLALWAEKTGKAVAERAEPEAARWGKVLEQVVLREWARRHEMEVNLKGRKLSVPGAAWLSGNIDAWTRQLGAEVPWQIGEVKMVSDRQAHRWENDDLPPEYYAQVQWYMGLRHEAQPLPYERAYVIALLGGNRLIVRTVEFDNDFYQAAKTAAYLFLQKVANKEQPDARPADAQLLARLYKGRGTSLLADEDMLADYKDLHELRTAYRVLESSYDAAKAHMQAKMGDHEILFDDRGEVLLTWKASERKLVDHKAIVHDFGLDTPEVTEKYTKVSPVRTFLLKEPRQ